MALWKPGSKNDIEENIAEATQLLQENEDTVAAVEQETGNST